MNDPAKLDDSVVLVAMSLTLPTKGKVPPYIRTIPFKAVNGFPLTSASTQPNGSEDSFLQHEQQVSLFYFVQRLCRSGYVMAGVSRVPTRSTGRRQRDDKLIFYWGRQEVMVESEQRHDLKCLQALRELCDNAIWRVSCLRHPMVEYGQIVDGANYVHVMADFRQPLLSADGLPNVRARGKRPQQIRPRRMLSVEQDRITMVQL